MLQEENSMDNRDNLVLLPTIALKGMAILPGMTGHFDLTKEEAITTLNRSIEAGHKLFLVSLLDEDSRGLSNDTVYHTGVIVVIKQKVTLPNHCVRVLVEGSERAVMSDLIRYDDGSCGAYITPYELLQRDLSPEEEKARIRILAELLGEYIVYQPKISNQLLKMTGTEEHYAPLLNNYVAQIPFPFAVKQKFLEQKTVEGLFQCFVENMREEISIQRIRSELNQKFASSIREKSDEQRREFILKEQLSAIRKELGEEDALPDGDEMEEMLSKLDADSTIKKAIQKEIARFRGLSGSSSEAAVQRTYIETLLELPWNKSSTDRTDLKLATEILERDHYGLKEVKERVLEFLAVRTLNSKGEVPILCLVGPPGTGKTSIARSIAEAMNRKYVRVCLGGVKDEAEIRGHRRTYVGAMPGRIVNAVKQAGVKNPFILLDEIDKLGSDFKGDPASALLEVLDSAQNYSFRDHYIELPMDLSDVTFVATANNMSTIPPALLDRLEIIELNSYTANEKFHIAKEHLWEKQLKSNGLKKQNLTITDGVIRTIISYYTKEAGVRSLERQFGKICRKTAKMILCEEKKQIRVNEKNLEDFLGKKKYLFDKIKKAPQIGVVRGLAWTQVGGDTLEIEVNVMPGKGEIELTGQLGDVMKESAIAGYSYIRSIAGEYEISEDFFKENDIHIHIPEGAVPKDGPSAGITMATAMLSAFTQTPVRGDLAMTGEITLRGRILPIGGLKEKLLAASEAGVKTVLIPKENQPDLEEIDAEIKDKLECVFVSNMKEVATISMC